VGRSTPVVSEDMDWILLSMRNLAPVHSNETHYARRGVVSVPLLMNVDSRWRNDEYFVLWAMDILEKRHVFNHDRSRRVRDINMPANVSDKERVQRI
jgi:hypothetical protein